MYAHQGLKEQWAPKAEEPLYLKPPYSFKEEKREKFLLAFPHQIIVAQTRPKYIVVDRVVG